MHEKSASEGQARQKSAKKRSLRGVNEHFKSVFNAAWPSAGSFRTKPSMRLVTTFAIAATMVIIPVNLASAFGEPNTWSSGWGQGVSEYIAVNHQGDELYIACSDSFSVSMTLTINGKSYGNGESGDFSLAIDGATFEQPYETSSRVYADNFIYAWDLLRKAHSIQAVTSDGIKVELPSQGSARALPASKTPEFSCLTEFYSF